MYACSGVVFVLLNTQTATIRNSGAAAQVVTSAMITIMENPVTEQAKHAE